MKGFFITSGQSSGEDRVSDNVSCFSTKLCVVTSHQNHVSKMVLKMVAIFVFIMEKCCS